MPNRQRSLVVLPAAALLFLIAGGVVAQDSDDCLICHSDPDMLHVDPEAYARSVHGDLDCVFCHSDLTETELPHADEVEPVDCSMCHGEQAEQHANSLHGQAASRGDPLAPGCADCHGVHDILSHTDDASPTSIMNVPVICGRCHREGSPVERARDIPQDHILENYSMSIHGFGLYSQGLTVTAVCTSCHTAHKILPHTEPSSSIHRDNVAATCSNCHGQIEQVHRAVIEGQLWQEEPHKIPACVDCHSPHKIRRVFYPAGMPTGTA